jgi:hypothetical protein
MEKGLQVEVLSLCLVNSNGISAVSRRVSKQEKALKPERSELASKVR